MTTTNIQEQMKTLEKLVPEYVSNNAESKAYGKVATEASKSIKDILKSVNMDTINVGEYKVSITHVDKSYMDTDKLLTFVKSELSDELKNKIIKTREYVDEEALENLMYKNEIDDDTKAKMAKCLVVKEELRLNVRKKKEGAEDDD